MPTNDVFPPWLKSKELAYSLKVWLTCLALGPIVFSAVLGMAYWSIIALFFLYMFFYGIFYSIPSLVLFYAIVELINRTRYSSIIKKSIFIVAGIILTLIPFYLYIEGDGLIIEKTPTLEVKLSYFIAVIPGLLFYKRPPGKAEIEEAEIARNHQVGE